VAGLGVRVISYKEIGALLALLYLYAGGQKLTMSQEALAQTPMGGYVLDYSARFLKMLGSFEVLGAIGLILPWLTGVLPWLTPLAAVGLAVIMLGAINVRYKRGETQFAGGTVVFFLLCVFVAYGRFFL